MVVVIIFFLSIIFYLYKTSKNNFFFQSQEDLEKAKKIMVAQLTHLGRNTDDINRFIKSYEWFCLNPERYDGSTIVRDLFDLKYNEEILSTASMWHDYDYIVNGANRCFIKNWKSNYNYVFIDLIKNGKGLHLERFLGLIIISIGFVPYNYFKNN